MHFICTIIIIIIIIITIIAREPIHNLSALPYNDNYVTVCMTADGVTSEYCQRSVYESKWQINRDSSL